MEFQPKGNGCVDRCSISSAGYTTQRTTRSERRNTCGISTTSARTGKKEQVEPIRSVAKMGRGEASSKKVITREQWEKKLASIKVKKEDMNKLVMNFLVTEGYLDAARLFQEESGTEMHGDEANITQRMHIRKAMQSGDVEGAIDKVNDLNPGILEDRDHLFFHLQQQKLIELIRDGNVEEALEFAQEYLAPRGEENEAFLEELEKTVALLAFEDASTCPIKDLLEFSQRQKTAGELNSAILASQGKEREPRLPSLLRMLTWAQQKLDEKVVYPRIDDLGTGKLEDPALE